MTPFVFSNLATSVDGKIATAGRQLFHLGTPKDRDQMQVLRRRADVVIMGASTLRSYRGFCGLRKLKRGEKQPANAILSSALEGIDPSWPFFGDPSRTRIIFHVKKLKPAVIKRFEGRCELVPLGAGPVARQMVDALTERGYRRLLVEGGGSLMWDFASENLIDEYHVTLTPWILGGTEAPTLVDGRGFNPEGALKLRLKGCRRIGEELYLTYARRGRPAST